MAPELALAALAVEAAIGYPPALHRRLPHPVTWLGASILWFEARWNDQRTGERRRRALGVLAVALTTAVAALAGWAIQTVLGRDGWGIAVAALLASTGLAQRSLFLHVRAIDRTLAVGDLSAARDAVAQIVGRDTERLDEQGVSAAALESLAESFNDGVVAPAFWLALLGLPGLFAYKALNAADSLIGHREARWRAFGWAAARADDVANLAPARLAGALIALAGGRGWRVMLRDAGKHLSPNAGWPEAAMAGALRRRLGGPACYDGVLQDRAELGEGPAPAHTDLARGLTIYLSACGLLWVLVGAGALAWPR